MEDRDGSMRGLMVKSSRSEGTARHDSKWVREDEGDKQKDRREEGGESRQRRRGW